MLELFTGVISGIFSAIGMGGGTILILILSVILGIDHHIAQATNLIFFIPTAITAIIMTIRRKLINWRSGIVVAISGILGAFLGATISVNMDVNKLKRYFGFFLIIITIHEIYSLAKMYKRDKKINNKNKERR